MARPWVIEKLGRHEPSVRDAAALRWREWGCEENATTLEDWVAVTRNECGPAGVAGTESDDLPFTLVARDPDGSVVGLVGLVEQDPEGLDDRSPWVVGTVVRPDRRSSGIGAALMAELHERAGRFDTLWVSTQRAAGFYGRCGYEPVVGHASILCRTRQIAR